MKFHPLKCKVLTVSMSNKTYYVLPFDRFVYCLDDVCLEYVESEKDLGVFVTKKLNWNQHVFYLCSKANKILGLVKRTCHFVKNSNQKMLLYLSLVCSQFNHCSSIWRPNTISLLNKIERVQTRAVKWILSEQNANYVDLEYFKKCKSLDMLPLKFRFEYFALLLFHRIIHKTITIKLPAYITLVTKTNLRRSHKDPLSFESSIKPRITKKNNQKTGNFNKKCVNKRKPSLIITKKTHTKKKKRNKKLLKFFVKRKKPQNIYRVNKNHIDEFNENKVFKNSYFYRTHIVWNTLPLELKIIENYNDFSKNLKAHMWKYILPDEDHGLNTSESSVGSPVGNIYQSCSPV